MRDIQTDLQERAPFFVKLSRAPMTQAEFLARAWRVANDKARELGWIA